MKYFALFFLLLFSCTGSRKLPEREYHILGGLEALPFDNYFEVEKGFIKRNLEKKGIAIKDLFFIYTIFTGKEDLCNLSGTIRREKLDGVINKFKGIVGAYVFDSEMNYILQADQSTILRHPVPLRSSEIMMVDEAKKNGFFVFLDVVNCDMKLGYNGKEVVVFHVVDDKLVRLD